jgi:hypothetical protein
VPRSSRAAEMARGRPCATMNRRNGSWR